MNKKFKNNKTAANQNNGKWKNNVIISYILKEK